MSLSPMQLIQGLEYKLSLVQKNAYTAINNIIAALQVSSSSCSYDLTNSTSIPNLVDTIIIFNSKLVDNSGSYNPSTGLYTAGISGNYRISYQVSYNAFNGNGSQFISSQINIDGISKAICQSPLESNVSGSFECLGMSKIYPLVQGQTVSISTRQGTGGSLLLALGGSTFVSIERAA
jgi:hypothetical protein